MAAALESAGRGAAAAGPAHPVRRDPGIGAHDPAAVCPDLPGQSTGQCGGDPPDQLCRHPLALVGSLLPAPLSGWLLVLAHGAVELLAALLAWLGSARLAVWAAPIPSPLAFGFAMLGTAWLLAPRGWPARWAGAAAWLPALSAVPDAPPAATFTATVFDVGQGMAVLVETAHHRLLYDAGPWYSPDSNGGNRVIVPYLKARGIGSLDALVISHSDADHAGGAPAVLDALPVSVMLSSLPSGHAVVRQAGAIARPCVAGQRWH